MGGSRGFTPIEVAVVVATVVLLVAMAMPTYQSHLIRTHRDEARELLLEAAERQRRYLEQQGHYATELDSLGLAVPASLQRFYRIDLSTRPRPAPAFTLTARPRVGTLQEDDGELRLHSDGRASGKW